MVSGRPEPARGGQQVNSGGGSRGGGQQPAPRVTRRARVTAPLKLHHGSTQTCQPHTNTSHTPLTLSYERLAYARSLLTPLSPAAASAATPHVLSPARSQTPPQLTLPAPHSSVYALCTVTSVLAITSYTPLKLGYKPACEIMTSACCHKMPSIHSSHSVTKCLPYTLSTLSQNSLHTLLSQNTLHTLFALSDKSLPHVLHNYYPNLPSPLLCPKQKQKKSAHKYISVSLCHLSNTSN